MLQRDWYSGSAESRETSGSGDVELDVRFGGVVRRTSLEFAVGWWLIY